MYAIRVEPSKILRDAPREKSWEDFGEKNMEEYFENGYALFLQCLAELKSPGRELAPAEEKELRFMLDALINAKNFLADRG